MIQDYDGIASEITDLQDKIFHDHDLEWVRGQAEKICDEYPPEWHTKNPGFYGQLVLALSAQHDAQKLTACIASLSLTIQEIAKDR